MGCWQSRVERDETVSICKARRGYMKQVVKGRQDFATAHLLYLRSLRDTGASLVQFADAESHLPHHLPPLLPSPPPTPPPPPRARAPKSQPPPPSDTVSSVRRPPPCSGSQFPVPFTSSAPPAAKEDGEEEDEEEAATVVPKMAVATSIAAVTPSSITVLSQFSKDPTSELTMVVSRKRKDLAEIVRELDEFFDKAAEAGNLVAMLFETQNCQVSSARGQKGKPCRYGKSLRPLLRYLSPDTRSRRSKKPRVEGTTVGSAMSHSSAVEQLYAWEKKLYMEVKDEERFREERRKRVSQVRKQEVKGVDNAKVQKNRKDIERLESKMAVASQAMETICIEIMRLRESELYPLLLELLNGLKAMWRSMYEYHHVQTHIAQQLEYLTTATTITGSAANATASGLRGKLTHELELAVKRWHSALGALVGSQREYIHAIAGWLRLSFFRFHRVPLSRTQQDSDIYALCEEWQLTLDKLPDKEASEAVKSLLTAVHAIVLRQEEEDRERRRWESAVKAVEKKTAELTALEDGRCPRSAPEDGEATVQWSPLSAKRAKVEVLRAGAEEEKAKYEKSASVTREITLSSLQRELPNVFQAMMAFSGACIEAFEAVHDHHRGDLDRARSLKMLLRP